MKTHCCTQSLSRIYNHNTTMASSTATNGANTGAPVIDEKALMVRAGADDRDACAVAMRPAVGGTRVSGDSCAVEDAARSPDAAGADVNGTVSRGAKRGHEHADGMRGVRARSGDVVEHVGAHSSSRSTACRSSQVAPGQNSPAMLMPSALCPSGAARAVDAEPTRRRADDAGSADGAARDQRECGGDAIERRRQRRSLCTSFAS